MGKISGQIQGTGNAIKTEPLLINTTVYYSVSHVSSKAKKQYNFQNNIN